MHFKLLVIFASISVVRNRDISIGSDGGRKIFEDTRFASPAIWRQVENVTVIAPQNEVISKVNITDMRADKDGDVNIVNGGEGEKSVTIEIKSPTVLRGYEFHIEVFSISESNYKSITDKTDIPEVILNNEYKTTAVPQDSGSESSEINKEIPISIAKDSDVLRPARDTNVENNIAQLPEGSETINTLTETGTEDDTTTENYLSTIDSDYNDGTTESIEGSGNEETPTNVIPSNWLRPARGVGSGNDLLDIPVESEATVTTTETSNEFDTSTDDISTSNDVENLDLTSEGPEVTPNDSDSVEPAQDTNNENEPTVTTTETLDKETTEDSLKVNDGDDAMNTPNVNSIYVPDYSALSILDYIRRKEQGARQIRRTDEQGSTEDQDNGNEGSLSPTEGSSTSDDTVDLVPPEIDAPHNDNFSPDPESTEESIVSSTSMLDITTEDSIPVTIDSTSESSLEEKSRNSRNTEDNLENSNNYDLPSETGTMETNRVDTNDKISTGIVLLKENHVIITSDGKQVEFTLPIVLIIGNENNFPIFKIVEDSSSIEEKELQQSDSTLMDSSDTNMDYEANTSNDPNNYVKTDEYSY